MKLAEARPRKQDKDNTLKDFFNKRLREFKKKILDVLTNIGVPDDVLMKVSFVPAGELSEPSLPDRKLGQCVVRGFLLSSASTTMQKQHFYWPMVIASSSLHLTGLPILHEDMNEKHSEEMQASKKEFKIPDSQAYSSGKNPGTRTPIEMNVRPLLKRLSA